MLVEIDGSGDEPLFAQIAGQLRAAIGRGEPAVGQRLPPARELAEALGVNMHTVLRAYALLRDEGLVEMRRRRGVIVREAGDGRARLVELARALHAEAARQGVPPAEVHHLLDEIPTPTPRATPETITSRTPAEAATNAAAPSTPAAGTADAHASSEATGDPSASPAAAGPVAAGVAAQPGGEVATAGVPSQVAGAVATGPQAEDGAATAGRSGTGSGSAPADHGEEIGDDGSASAGRAVVGEARTGGRA